MPDCTLVRRHASVHEHMRTHARAHACRWTPSPIDAELVGSAVLRRVTAKRRPLPLLYTENAVLFSMPARWLALAACLSQALATARFDPSRPTGLIRRFSGDPVRMENIFS